MPTPWIVCGPSKNSIVGPIAQAQLVVQPADLGVFVGHPLVRRHAVGVAALDHERPRHHQRRHLGVVERAAHVEIGHFPFDREHEAVAASVEATLRAQSLKSAEQIDRQ